MLKSLKFKEDFRKFKQGDEIIFRAGVNYLVGEQGVGKSSLLSLLSKDEVKKTKEIISFVVEGATTTYTFDFEKMSHRLRRNFGRNDSTNMMVFQVKSMWSSHGEYVLQILSALNGLKDRAILFMDEPDTALSPRSCEKTSKLFKDLALKGHQIIASTHNPIMFLQETDVLNIETRSWISSADYLKSHIDVSIFENLIKT